MYFPRLIGANSTPPDAVSCLLKIGQWPVDIISFSFFFLSARVDERASSGTDVPWWRLVLRYLHMSHVALSARASE